MAAIGHANRFMTARGLVAYLGLDLTRPKVRHPNLDFSSVTHSERRLGRQQSLEPVTLR